jgi:hypothetical protein
MSIHEQARAEAEKRFPERFVKDGPLADYYDENAGYRGVYAAGFLAGHETATRTRVVSTVAELDALPDGTVMRARNEALREMGTLRDGTRVVWAEGWSLLDDAVKYDAPFTVLHEPEETP